ncbi:hypothetical protein SAMN05216490_1818 [Mucilaginibacter mallensis]|uniref:Uncharacterized protein n=1 Tax=Mucilaginibacter mallensis TaxID=652787 RepID=A0A1H1V2M2_MUCMA|nr:hypothetical protein SAMN05216490_1818 [Mucilaginibacter mallensis]
MLHTNQYSILSNSYISVIDYQLFNLPLKLKSFTL